VSATGIGVAIFVPSRQQRLRDAADARSRAEELSNLRHALHTEVGTIATQCHAELWTWLSAPPPPAIKNLRTSRLPPLAIYQANLTKIGLLTRDEIVQLIGFSGTLHDIAMVVDDMAQRQAQGPDERKTIELLLSNACGHAADFLEAVPGIAGADQDRPFIEELRKAHEVMADEGKPPPSFNSSKNPA
jgi:hypothetical protein